VLARFDKISPAREQRMARGKTQPCAKTPSPARLKRDFTRFAVSKIEMKSQRATAKRGGAKAEPQ